MMPEDEFECMPTTFGDRLESRSEVARGGRSPGEGLRPISGVSTIIGPGLAVLKAVTGIAADITGDRCLGL
jgi:hypothetical protein